MVKTKTGFFYFKKIWNCGQDSLPSEPFIKNRFRGILKSVIFKKKNDRYAVLLKDYFSRGRRFFFGRIIVPLDSTCHHCRIRSATNSLEFKTSSKVLVTSLPWNGVFL